MSNIYLLILLSSRKLRHIRVFDLIKIAHNPSLCERIMTYMIVFTTVPSKKEAVKIVRALLEEKLIACANIMDSISSFFWWKGKIEEEKEVLVLMKSHENLFKRLLTRVAELHSYDVPEVLAVPIVNGSPSYMDWMKACFEPVNCDE